MSNSDENKRDDAAAMDDLQTRLITQDTLTNALTVHTDEETGNVDRIDVFDPVTRGEKQPNQYRDAPFAVLFLVHLVAVCFFAFVWGLPVLFDATGTSGSNSTSTNDDDNTVPNSLNLAGLLGLCFLATLSSIGILSGALAFMIRYASVLIQFSLMGSIALSVVCAILFGVAGLGGVAVIYVLLAALGGWYAWCVWRRIPFARTNLVAATTAIKTNLGIVGVAFGLVVAVCVWSALWMLSFAGIYMRTQSCNEKSGECDESALGRIVGIFYLLSFYWTCQVIKNILVVTVSGVVGTWWFAPQEAASFCSTAILDSLRRATSYSLGSICFGSLLMAIIQVMNHMIHQARRHGRGNDLLLCILECLVNCLESIAEYFNKFAFIYTGLYGYDYLTAGKKVMQLFSERGWTTIINDQLIYRVLNLVTLVVAGLSGCVGVLLAYLIPSWVESLDEARYVVAFLLPFLIGAALAHVVLGVVASATDTVIVCFAESPSEFQANYPSLSRDMLDAWRQIYPDVAF